jgi:hypothetical protein
MMSNASKASLAMLALSVFGVAGSAGLLLLPAIRASEARTAECGRLLSQVSRYEEIAAARDRLRAEVEVVRRDSVRVLRTIPGTADQAQLMRMLAVSTGPDMGTQTIVAGDPLPATMRGSTGYQAVPVTVEMKASFERVMEVLARAEGDRRLVRPIRVEITRPQDEPARGSRAASQQPDNFVEARIEVDAVYGAAAMAAGGEEP